MNEDNNKYYLLDYTHNELKALLKKLEDNMLLTQDQYDQLINKIGLDNISTFDLDYYKLTNAPRVPTLTSHLGNNSGFIDTDQLKDFKETEIEPLLDKIIVMVEDIENLKNLNVDNLVETILELNEELQKIETEIYTLQDFTVDYKTNLENVHDALEDMQDKDKDLRNNIELNFQRIEVLAELISINKSDISNLVDISTMVDSNLLELKAKTDEIKESVDLINELRELLIAVKINDRLQEVEDYIENLALEDFAKEETVTKYYDKVLGLEQFCIYAEEDINTLQEKTLAVAQAWNRVDERVIQIEENMPIINSNIENIKSDVLVIRSLYTALEDIIKSLQSEDFNSELNELLTEIANTIASLNKDIEFVNSQIEIFYEEINYFRELGIENLATKSYVEEAVQLLSDQVETYVDVIEDRLLTLEKETGSIELSNYATKEELNLKANKTELFNRDYNNLINKPVIPNLDGYATEEYVQDAINNAQFKEDDKNEDDNIDNEEDNVNIDLSNYVTKDELSKVIDMFGGKSFRYVTQEEYNTLSDEEKSNKTIVWVITDKKNTESLLQDKINELEKQIELLLKRVADLEKQSNDDYEIAIVDEAVVDKSVTGDNNTTI